MRINNYKIGDKATLSRSITSKDIFKFADLTGDNNPIHIDEHYASTTKFKGRIAHGLLVSGLIATILGTKLPGEGAIYLSQSLKFLHPVMVNDFITAEVEIIHINIERNRLTLKTRCFNQDGIDVITGEAMVLAPL